jgi:hypothetical protein
MKKLTLMIGVVAWLMLGASAFARDMAQSATATGADAARGRIVFFRPSRLVGAIYTYHIAEVDEDGKVSDASPRLGDLPNGGAFVLEAEPGVHNYNITGPMALNLAKDRLRMEVEPGVTYYVEQTVRIGLVTGGFRLVPADEARFVASKARLDRGKATPPPVARQTPPPPAAPPRELAPEPRPVATQAPVLPPAPAMPAAPAPAPVYAPVPAYAAPRPASAAGNQVEGRGLLTREGQTRTCAGREARIIPADPAAEAFLREAFGASRKGLILSTQWEGMPFHGAPPVTTCDDQGRFRFSGLPDGDYYLAVVVSWEVPSSFGAYLEQRGGTIVAPVTLSGGGVTSVIVAN